MTTPSAYGLIKEIIDNNEKTNEIIDFSRSNNILSSNQLRALKRPGQSNKFPISVILNSMRDNIGSIKELIIKNPNIKSLIELVVKETTLLSAFDDKKVFSKILSRSGIKHGNIVEITKLRSPLSYPFIVKTGKKSFFVKYIAPFGPKYVIRADPKEVIFKNLLGEYVFRELFGESFVTKTIWPTFEIAESKRKLADSPNESEILNERLIIQECYTPEYIKLSDIDDLALVGNIFGNLIANLHSGTMGLNNSNKGLVKKHIIEIRDRTLSEYIEWLEKANWVKKRFYALNDMNNKDVITYLGKAKKRLNWESLVKSSKFFWQEGAVLVTQDMRPKNIFYNRKKGTRIFDFDSLVFYDPSYHAAEVMFFCVKDITDKGVTDGTVLIDLVSNFLGEYLKSVDVKNQYTFLRSSTFRKSIVDYFIFFAMSRYLSDYVCGLTSSEKMQAVYETTINLIKT